MDKLSGLVLDMHDDVTGSVIRSLYPRVEEIPEVIKTASEVTPEQRESLPDSVFALILHDGDTTLRKYACVDAGNTLLNIAYFLQTYDKLPMEAIKTAADNLCTACGWYDIEAPDELKKLSTGALPTVGRQRVWKDLDGTTYSSSGQSWGAEKNAEVIGSIDMPLEASKEKTDPKKSQLSVAKTAEEQFLDNMNRGMLLSREQLWGKEAEGPNCLEVGEGLPEQDNMKQLPQAKKLLHPHVDVTSHEPPKVVEEKKASLYAMPSLQRYPLDGIDHLVKAASFFDQQYKLMAPEDRREFAYNMCKRAHSLHLPMSEIAEQYGGNEGYAKEAQLSAGLEMRKQLLIDGDDGTEGSREKVAHISGLYDSLFNGRSLISPDLFAATLQEIDKLAGLEEQYDTGIYDPWYCTFGKLAEEINPKDSISLGGELMKVQDLATFAKYRSNIIKNQFGDDFLSEFQKDPVGIFDSLPMDQKKVILRMVNNSHSLTGGASTS